MMMRQRGGTSQQQSSPENNNNQDNGSWRGNKTSATTPSRRRGSSGGSSGLNNSARSSSWEITTNNDNNDHHFVGINIIDDPHGNHDHEHHGTMSRGDTDTVLPQCQQQTGRADAEVLPQYQQQAQQHHRRRRKVPMQPVPQHHYSTLLNYQEQQQQQQSSSAPSSSRTTAAVVASGSDEKLRHGRLLDATTTTDFYSRQSPSSSSSSAAAKWKFQQHTKHYRLEDFHNVFRTPLHVPDSQYEAHLLGQRSGRRKNEIPVITRTCCARFCAIFSGIGFGFLLFVAILLDTQPLYIPGTLPELVVQSTVTIDAKNGQTRTYTKPTMQYLVPGPDDERLPTARTAYRAALLYFCTLLVSLYILDPSKFPHCWWCSRWTRRFFYYENIPDALPKFRRQNSSGSSGGGELFGPRSSTAQYYPRMVWNRMTGFVKRWLASRGWYKPRTRKYKQRKKG